MIIYAIVFFCNHTITPCDYIIDMPPERYSTLEACQKTFELTPALHGVCIPYISGSKVYIGNSGKLSLPTIDENKAFVLTFQGGYP